MTGCACIIYIWNPVVTKMYIAKLEGHTKSIVDVRIFEHLNLMISISKDEVIYNKYKYYKYLFKYKRCSIKVDTLNISKSVDFFQIFIFDNLRIRKF